MDFNPISITYILLWLREKRCPEEIRCLIMEYVKHPVSIIFSKEVLQQEKTFLLHKTYSEGWLWESYFYEEKEEFDKLISDYWWVRRDITLQNRKKGLQENWRSIQSEEGIRQGDKVPLWWTRKHEPYYVLGSKPRIWHDGPDMLGFGDAILEYGSGITRETYQELVRNILTNRKAKQLFRIAKMNGYTPSHVRCIMWDENIHIVGNINQRNFCRRIEETIKRPLDEVSLRKNACIHTLLGCRCCNILHDYEHISPNHCNIKDTIKIKKAYEDYTSYGERRKMRKK